MTEQDRYCFFLINAITNPKVSPQAHYFVDQNKDLLVCINSDTLKRNKAFFTRMTELHSISYEEKVKHVDEYVLNCNNDDVIMALRKALSNFHEHNEIWFFLDYLRPFHYEAVQFNLWINTTFFNLANVTYDQFNIDFEHTKLNMIYNQDDLNV